MPDILVFVLASIICVIVEKNKNPPEWAVFLFIICYLFRESICLRIRVRSARALLYSAIVFPRVFFALIYSKFAAL